MWKTRSGIEAGTWASRLLESLLERKCRQGFVFTDKKGKQTKALTLEPRFFDQLHWVRMQYPDLFPPNVNIEDDYEIPRSCWRGSSTEAANQGGPSEIIEMICRWRKVERAQGRAPNLGMREHYMEVTQALEAFLQADRGGYCCLLVRRFGAKGDSYQVRTMTGDHGLTCLLVWDRFSKSFLAGLILTLASPDNVMQALRIGMCNCRCSRSDSARFRRGMSLLLVSWK
jgi:hypothetical protein